MGVRFQSCAAVLLMLLGSILTGCGGGGLDRAEVRGRVTFEGAPVQSGSIAVIPAAGPSGPSVGAAINGGTYEIARTEGPVPGSYRVEIRATRKTGQQIEAGEGADDPSAMIDEIEMYIPPEYNSDSTLTAEVQAGTNEIDFALGAGEAEN